VLASSISKQQVTTNEVTCNAADYQELKEAVEVRRY